MAQSSDVQLLALPGIPLVQPGDDIARLILEAIARRGEILRAGDVVVIAQKIVSKAEGRAVALADISPSPRARELAEVVGKDARILQLILDESQEVLRARRDVIIVVHRTGFVMANAGIDLSNVEHGPDGERALLLPLDPDGSCARIRATLEAHSGVPLSVIINDSHGRAWRNGTVGVAIGASGMAALQDLRGWPDLFGRALRITQVGRADELAAAASLVMGQSDEGTPVVLVRGAHCVPAAGNAADLVRPKVLDLFR